ncbi:hypothetical protein IPM19_04475 [bacterium]|nr:MAG: hypothetical protein IPM19_04475 [bacterium]
MKKVLLHMFLTLVTVVVFGWMPITAADAQRAATPTSSSGNRVQDGLNDIKEVFPETVVDKGATPQSLAKTIIDYALYLAAIISVLFIIIGGYYYITARGDEAQAKKGRTTLVNALIGLAIVVLSFVIVQVAYRFLIDER